MKNIFQRNKVIVYFGIGLALLFVLIIFFGEQEGGLTKLADIIVREEETTPEKSIQKTQQNKNGNITPVTPPPPYVDEEKELEKKLTKPVEERIKALAPVVFTFTEEGFSPRSDEGVRGQKAIWVNNTDKQIVIYELIERHEDFAKGVVIEPNGLFETILKGNGFWTFKEMESEKIGRILIYNQASE